MRGKLRVTFVLPFAGLVGGIRVIAIYADRLKQRGHEVFVVSTPAVRPTLRRAVGSILRGHGWPSVPRNVPSYFDRVDVEHRVLETHRAVTDNDIPDGDVVIATWWKTAPWVVGLSPSKGAKAYFVQDYGAHAGQPLEKVVESWHLPLHKITISKWLLRLIEHHSGDSDVTYVPNSVDCAQFRAPPRGKQPHPTVGLMYSNRPQKGVDIMLDSIQVAKRRLADLRVVAFGPSDPTRDMPLPPGSEYTRSAPDNVLRDIYSKCDAWLFGSRLEGFGLPILEAMACRTPVIATPAGAAPELLAEGGGVLVRPEDPDDMARAITLVCELPEHDWRAMSDAAYRIACRYTWDDATDLFEAGLWATIQQAKRLPDC